MVGVIEIIFWKVICVCVFFVFSFVLYVSRSKFVWLPLFLLSIRSHSRRRLENDTCYAAQDRTCKTWQTTRVGSGHLYFLLEFFIKKAIYICHLKSYLSFITYITNELN